MITAISDIIYIECGKLLFEVDYDLDLDFGSRGVNRETITPLGCL